MLGMPQVEKQILTQESPYRCRTLVQHCPGCPGCRGLDAERPRHLRQLERRLAGQRALPGRGKATEAGLRSQVGVGL